MGSVPSPAPGADVRPNFLVIVADDLGYSDIGCFGSEIQTPALDKLAASGVRLTNFHTASACSPTRSMLFSGTDNHIAGLGQMSEHMAGHADKYKDQPGYEGYLNFRVAALSEILQDAGYCTILLGKWHLGLSKETSPNARGFDKSFAFLSGCGNHFNYEPQIDDPTHCLFTPMNASKFWMQDDRFLDRTKDLPSDFYSSTTFADRLIDYIQEGAEEDRQRTGGQQKPFFAYLPFTAPHWPVQAPRETINKYKGLYNDGPGALRTKRLQRLVDMGIIPDSVEPAPLTIGQWDKMTAEERQESSRKMEVFAAMVDLIDVNVGKVVDHLDAIGQLDNTFILFMSDNGAEGAMLEALPMMGDAGSVNRIINKYYDNSLDNMGMPDSYIWYGPEWACASMAPSRGFKTWITEGGIRCPCLVRYPPLFSGPNNDNNGVLQNSKQGARKLTNSFATVMDILPTILDLASVPHPGTHFRARDVVLPRGKSWVPHLSSIVPSFHNEEKHITGWELFSQRAIRQGHWKALYMTAPRGSDKWELYNLRDDPGELRDMAEEQRDILEGLVRH